MRALMMLSKTNQTILDTHIKQAPAMGYIVRLLNGKNYQIESIGWSYQESSSTNNNGIIGVIIELQQIQL